MTLNLPPPSDGTDNNALNAAEGSHGGRLATVISALAFVFSGLSYYESALKAADLEIYVPPIVQYARDGGGDTELFAVPITIANSGSNTGTVLAMELIVDALDAKDDLTKSKAYYSAYFGEHPKDTNAINKSFAPIAIPSRATYTETIRFYPQGNALPHAVRDAGNYRFTLKTTIALPAARGFFDNAFGARAPDALVFERRLPYLSDQWLGMRRGSAAMHSADWKPTASIGK